MGSARQAIVSRVVGHTAVEHERDVTGLRRRTVCGERLPCSRTGRREVECGAAGDRVADNRRRRWSRGSRATESENARMSPPAGASARNSAGRIDVASRSDTRCSTSVAAFVKKRCCRRSTLPIVAATTPPISEHDHELHGGEPASRSRGSRRHASHDGPIRISALTPAERRANRNVDGGRARIARDGPGNDDADRAYAEPLVRRAQSPSGERVEDGARGVCRRRELAPVADVRGNESGRAREGEHPNGEDRRWRRGAR